MTILDSDNSRPGSAKRAFWVALLVNFFWINASEIWRYLAVVRPMLQNAYPGRADIAPFTLPVFASWSVWDSVLILAATGFYWLFLSAKGRTLGHAILAATYLTITVFGLVWLGMVNIGFVKPIFIWVAVPLAWAEQVVASVIVFWVLGRSASHP